MRNRLLVAALTACAITALVVLTPSSEPASGGGRAGAARSTPAPPNPAKPVIRASPSGISIGQALRDATGGETILVGAGSYPEILDSRSRSGLVTVKPTKGARVRIAGARHLGGQNVRYEGVTFTKPIILSFHGRRGGSQPSRNIQFLHSEFTSNRDGTCLLIRSATQRVRIENSVFHDCQHGVRGPGFVPHSSGIRIVGNEFRGFVGDAISFGHWNNVVIARNRIHDMNDPGPEHNDGIQIYGASNSIRIERNRIWDSEHQLLLIQDPVTGPNNNVLVRNNLMYDCGAKPIQIQGSTNVRLINNTVHGCRYKSVTLRKGVHGLAQRDTVLVNNIFPALAFVDGAGARTVRNNLFFQGQTGRRTTGEIRAAPRFVTARKGDFRLRRSSRASGAADRAYAPKVDLRGKRRPKRPSIGALEVRRTKSGKRTRSR